MTEKLTEIAVKTGIEASFENEVVLVKTPGESTNQHQLQQSQDAFLFQFIQALSLRLWVPSNPQRETYGRLLSEDGGEARLSTIANDFPDCSGLDNGTNSGE
ncbi:unnamed protein product [Trichobilharzia regenti]|nr:unnamed protein product [Trichobilharzia regenti]